MAARDPWKNQEEEEECLHADGVIPYKRRACAAEDGGGLKAGVLEQGRGDVRSRSRGVHLSWGRDTLRIAPRGKEEGVRMLDHRSGRKMREFPVLGEA